MWIDAQIKKAALEEAPFATEEAWVEDVAKAQSVPSESETATAVETDPTVAHAGLTEINDVQPTNGHMEQDSSSAPPASSIDTGAANTAAEEQWDKPTSADDTMGESFEMVPRDPTETESPAAAAPISSVQSWADDTPEAPAAAAATPSNGNDGFSEVQHNRGGRGRGSFQGEGRGGYRGRGGQRGDGRGRGGRGRGRGDFRGGPRGGFRGGRGGESQ